MSASRAVGLAFRYSRLLKIAKVLTDNGKEFSDRFCASGEREPTGKHLFDTVCAARSSEHRFVKPAHPQTNGMIERFNGRIGEQPRRSATRMAGKAPRAIRFERK